MVHTFSEANQAAAAARVVASTMDMIFGCILSIRIIGVL